MTQPMPSTHPPSSGGTVAKVTSRDDLTAIQGIGITAENRLYRAGIRSFVDLASAAPETLEKILGEPRPGICYAVWIAHAQALAR